MRYSIFLSFLMFIGCLSSPKQQKESFSEKVSDTLVVVKDTENVDERHLKKAMADALEKITASFQGKDWEYMYDFDTTEEGYAPIGVYIKVRKFAEGAYYAVIYTYDQAETLIRLYRIDNNTMQEKVSKSFPLLTDPSDTIFDANGDGVKDFALRYYPLSGCCRRDIYYLYLSPEKKEGVLSYIELINPTFYPKEHLIRGIGYGRPGHVELYKYRWREDVLDTLEYILPDMATKGKTFLKAKRIRDFYDTAKGKEIRLTKLPNEYQTVIGLDYFLDYTAEDFNSD
ncbi:hypothetical protein [Capnocytophaga gingivalis]